jgi:hypothetical protein
MDREEMLSKLELIEEQAKHTLEEFPQHLTKERQRMIIALVKHIRWMVTEPSVAVVDPEATVPVPAMKRVA